MLGRSPKRPRVHSSMYAGLRTNLPREVMSYSDFAFDATPGGGTSTSTSGGHPTAARPAKLDGRTFPGHAEVQRYLDAFADVFGLRRHVRFGTSVRAIRSVPPAQGSPAALATEAAGGSGLPWPAWQVTTQQQQQVGQVVPSPAFVGAAGSDRTHWVRGLENYGENKQGARRPSLTSCRRPRTPTPASAGVPSSRDPWAQRQQQWQRRCGCPGCCRHGGGV